MKDVEFHSIDGLNFVTEEYAFDFGWPLFISLLKVCGKSILSFLFEGLDGIIKETLSGSASKEKVLSMDVMELLGKIDRSKVVGAFESFFERLDPVGTMQLTKEILSTTKIVASDKTRREIDFVSDFKGKYGTVIKLLRNVLTMQFQSSFQGLLSGLTDQSKSEPKVPVMSRVVAR